MVDLRKEAKGRECTVRIPGVCNFNPETVVLAHLPIAGLSGMGMKTPDIIGAWACSDCHDCLDYRVNKMDWSIQAIKDWGNDGLKRTLAILSSEEKI